MGAGQSFVPVEYPGFQVRCIDGHSPGVEKGQLTYKENPEYPSKAQKANVQGAVVLEALIDKKGKVKDVKVVSGDPLLTEAAAKAVRHWRYTPYKLQGQPVEVRTQVTLTFSLHREPVDCPGTDGSLYFSEGNGTGPGSAGGKETASPDAYKIFRARDGVKPPKATYTPDPKYTQEERGSKPVGTVVLLMIVTPEGRPTRVQVARSLDYDLDQRAIDAVCTWKFQPATKDGKAVAVQINVEVTFRQ